MEEVSSTSLLPVWELAFCFLPLWQWQIKEVSGHGNDRMFPEVVVSFMPSIAE